MKRTGLNYLTENYGVLFNDQQTVMNNDVVFFSITRIFEANGNRGKFQV